MTTTQQQITEALTDFSEIRVAFIFGSFATNRQTPESDLDVAVAFEKPLAASDKISLIDALAIRSGRPVDLVDLQTASGTILREALTHGRLLLCRDRNMYASLILRMWYDTADILPIFRSAQEKRIEAFAHG